MWKILQYNFDSKDLDASNHGLFHESFHHDNDDGDEEHTVEMQISHNPTTEVDLSNGQALPPYSGYNSANPSQQQAGQQHGQQLVDEHSPAASNARTLDMLYAPFPKAPTAPWAMPNNGPVIDMNYDPFYQFQDLSTLTDAAWEVGNL